MTSNNKLPASSGDIAIVGLSVCVPGAQSLDTFWSNLRNGVESIEFPDEDALREAGENPEKLSDPNYVRATARLSDFDTFDAEFFGFGPKEAAILDPQHRKFLEVAWEAMETAGHPPERFSDPIGVYAGCGMGSYFYFNICSNPDLVDDVGMFLLRHTGNDKDFLSTRVSHVFDLKGPSLNIQTACSTSLVAIHTACEALRSGEIGMALAGGVTIEIRKAGGTFTRKMKSFRPTGIATLSTTARRARFSALAQVRSLCGDWRMHGRMGTISGLLSKGPRSTMMAPQKQATLPLLWKGSRLPCVTHCKPRKSALMKLTSSNAMAPALTLVIRLKSAR